MLVFGFRPKNTYLVPGRFSTLHPKSEPVRPISRSDLNRNRNRNRQIGTMFLTANTSAKHRTYLLDVSKDSHTFIERPTIMGSENRKQRRVSLHRTETREQLLWYGLGRPVVTSEIGNWSFFVLLRWRFVFGTFMKLSLIHI